MSKQINNTPNEQKTDWRERLDKWIATQHGSAGWELKLSNLIESILINKVEEFVRDLAVLRAHIIPKHYIESVVMDIDVLINKYSPESSLDTQTLTIGEALIYHDMWVTQRNNGRTNLSWREWMTVEMTAKHNKGGLQV
jgi:hypothetical protein